MISYEDALSLRIPGHSLGAPASWRLEAGTPRICHRRQYQLENWTGHPTMIEILNWIIPPGGAGVPPALGGTE